MKFKYIATISKWDREYKTRFQQDICANRMDVLMSIIQDKRYNNDMVKYTEYKIDNIICTDE